MDQGLKERLVGAAVLVAIAVWLIPWVLDGPEGGTEAPASSLQLPSAEEPMPMRTQTLRLGDAADADAQRAPVPTASSTPAAATQDPVAVHTPPTQTEPQHEPEPETEREAATEPQSAVVAVAPAAERPAPTAAPVAAPAPPPKAAAAVGDWTVQLGSFGEEANARRLAQRASTFGYKAEVSSYRSAERTLYRVRVGPHATRAAADAAASALKAHGLDARVVAAR